MPDQTFATYHPAHDPNEGVRLSFQDGWCKGRLGLAAPHREAVNVGSFAKAEHRDRAHDRLRGRMSKAFNLGLVEAKALGVCA